MPGSGLRIKERRRGGTGRERQGGSGPANAGVWTLGGFAVKKLLGAKGWEVGRCEGATVGMR